MWPSSQVIFVALHILSAPLYLLLLLLIYKLIVLILAKKYHDFVEPLPGSHCIFFSDEIWTRPHSSILVGLTLEGNAEKGGIVRVLENAYNLKDSRGKRCYRQLAYYPVRFLSHGFWKRCPNFKISDRIHHWKENDGALHTEQWMSSMVQKLVRKPYKMEEPLWDVFFVHGCTKKGAKQTLLYIRFHHVLCDGMSYVKFFYALRGADKLPEMFTKPGTSMDKWNQLASSVLIKMRTLFNLATVGFVDYVSKVLIEKDKHPLHFGRDGQLKLTGDWICGMGTKLELEVLKKGSKQYGCSVVHVILAGVSGGIQRYLSKYHGDEPMPQGFHLLAPLPLPSHPNMKLVNYWCAAKMHLKTGIQGASNKLEYLRKETQACAAATFPVMSAFTFQYLCGLLPISLVDILSKPKATSTVILSNIVGPPDNWTLGSCKVLETFFWMPIPAASIALSAGVVSYNGGIRFCLIADTGAIPEKRQLQDLTEMIYSEVQEICQRGRS